MRPTADVVVIGGGIVGLATAWTLLHRKPSQQLIVLEKEDDIASHQTGHNSGVVHSGIYYRPGSLKAQLCVRGGAALLQFCDAQHICYKRCGKVIVARTPDEGARLELLLARGQANQVPGVHHITAAELTEIEPHVTGSSAIHLPDVAIVDFHAVARALADDIRLMGAQVLTMQRVQRVRSCGPSYRVEVQGTESLMARRIVNCGGLHADRIARHAGTRPAVQIVPFRGEYYELTERAARLVRGLIYPVPDPALPFLGVHLTKMMTGGVHVGPNAVLAWKREGYHGYDWSVRDSWEMLTYPGWWRMSARHWRTGIAEQRRSWSRRQFVRAVQQLVPSITLDDLATRSAGVRAQAVDRRGTLVDDFVIEDCEGMVHVCNAPSPAATASLAIGEVVADRVQAL